jgi:hypothetical protein
VYALVQHIQMFIITHARAHEFGGGRRPDPAKASQILARSDNTMYEQKRPVSGTNAKAAQINAHPKLLHPCRVFRRYHVGHIGLLIEKFALQAVALLHFHIL